MLHTRFCELFEIEAPILQAPIWPATTPELVAAVSEAGGLAGASPPSTVCSFADARSGRADGCS